MPGTLTFVIMQKIVTDQLGNTITLNYPPKRIVSLVPSQTELLFDLGLDKELVGITHFCIHPESKVTAKTRIGGTKKVDIQMIRSLKPDLIIANKEENERADVEALAIDFPVWVSDVSTLEDASDMISNLGLITDRSPEATYLNYMIAAGFRDLQHLAVEKGINLNVLYIIWKKPYMAAGRGTFIDDVLQRIGLNNVVNTSRYPVLEDEDFNALKPALVFLSSEPYPFSSKHLAEFQKIYPKSRVMLVDGEMFSWYGSRLLKSIEYLFYLQQAVSAGENTGLIKNT